MQFLRDTLPILLEDIDLRRRANLLFQQDGAPPHFTRAVTVHLNATYPNRWIGRNGPILWPPRSPDLTPMDYFLWGHVKEKVYSRPVLDREDCQRRIRNAFLSIDEAMIRRSVRNIVHRAELLLEQGGGNFEQLL